MAVVDYQTDPKSAEVASADLNINDFAIIVATPNGSGSQTANNTILRACFNMGIPVTGKNLFPSNIKGLPTWYSIRLSKDGYQARRYKKDILVAMNAATFGDDLKDLEPGGVCLYPDDSRTELSRTDISYYPMPVKELVKQSGVGADLRDYIANMVYVGVLAHLIGIEVSEIESAISKHFKGKAKPIQINMGVVNAAIAWAQANLSTPCRFRAERLDKTTGMIMLDGNTAAALGSIFGGVTVAAWYPITPSTSVIDGLNEYLPQLRVDAETGKPNYAVIQAEDELAAIGMVLGAGWAGARAMTSTSGPGISLMAEFAGLSYFAEIPGVIWDVMRMGPSTGMPTRTSQGDILSAYFLSHGDTQHVCLLPGSIKECFEFGYVAFDLAERLQTLIFVLSDLDLGMNQWMSAQFDYPETPLDRGKVLTADDLNTVESWGRYRDVDGDGIPFRTLPGTNHPKAAYFTRGSGHNADAKYTERSDEWLANLDRLAKKFQTARTIVPKPVDHNIAGAT
ncbi:MAG TPA: 2-oxoacid:acceptor oxidoreductase family protein, partial [Herpetosiphonaceae bacterium]|nr:2-oxoacid:acceptor oxidoreductase family protein [Herpetosiphonaceae bacterium]